MKPDVTRSRYKRLAKEGGWIVLGQIVTVLGSLALVRVLTESLDLIQYGQLTLGLTLAGLVNQALTGGVSASIGRYYSIASEKNDVNNYLYASECLLKNVAYIVASFGLMLVIGLFYLGSSNWIFFAVIILIYSLVSGYNAALNGIQNAARQRAIVAFHGGLDAWLKILFAVCLIIWFGTSSSVVVIGYLCSSLFVTLSQRFFLYRSISQIKSTTPTSEPWLTQMRAYALPFSTWGLFTWMQQASDRWALQAFSTISDVGQYAVLFQLGFAPIAVLTGVAVSFLGPILYSRSGDASSIERNTNVDRFGMNMTHIVLFITFLMFLITYMTRDWLFELLVAAEYRQCSYLLPWMVLSGGLFAAGQIIGLKLLSEMRPSSMTTVKIVTAVLGVVFNILGALFAGLNGVVFALLLFSVVYFLWMYFLALNNGNIHS